MALRNIGSFALLAAAVLAPSASGAQSAAPTAPALSRGWVFEEQGGAALYAEVCAGCHQAEGKGAVGAASYPALAANRALASAGYVESVILNGLDAMPPLGSMMSDQQTADVINYVRTHFGNNYSDEVSSADIKAARPHPGAGP